MIHYTNYVKNAVEKVVGGAIISGQLKRMTSTKLSSEHSNFALTPDLTKAELTFLFNLAPEKAIAFLEKKGNKLTWSWKEQLELNNAKVFTVAKVAKMDILEDIRGMLDKSLKEGLPFKKFQKELTTKLQGKGWIGTEEKSPWRMKNIYDTNTQSVYNAGRWKGQQGNIANRPWLIYDALIDGSTSDICRNLNGLVLRADDPRWRTLYTPNHYGCRSTIRALTDSQYNRIKKPKTSSTQKPDEGFLSNPGVENWVPKKSDYSPDIWKTASPVISPLLLLPVNEKEE